MMNAIAPFLLIGLLAMFSSCRGQQVSNAVTGPLSDKGVMVVFQDKDGQYWFPSDGVYRYDGKDLTHFTAKDGLCADGIPAIRQDQSGNLYFDLGECVSKFDGKTFRILPQAYPDPSGHEWKLEPGDLWFRGTWDKNGPYRYDGDSLYHLQFPKHALEDEFYAKFPNVSYSPYGIYTIYTDRRGHVWFGTSTFGVCRFDGRSLSWISEEELTELDDGPAPGVRSILEDQDGNFWFGNTLYRYVLDQDELTGQEVGEINFSKRKGIDPSQAPEGVDLTYYMSAVEDDGGNLWLATYDAGVWKYDGEQLTHYPVKEGSANVTLFSIYKDRQGVLWLGTHSAGTYRFNGEAFEKFRP